MDKSSTHIVKLSEERGVITTSRKRQKLELLYRRFRLWSEMLKHRGDMYPITSVDERSVNSIYKNDLVVNFPAICLITTQTSIVKHGYRVIINTVKGTTLSSFHLLFGDLNEIAEHNRSLRLILKSITLGHTTLRMSNLSKSN